MRGIALGRDAAGAGTSSSSCVDLLSNACDAAARQVRTHDDPRARVVPSSTIRVDAGGNAGHGDDDVILGGMVTKDELVRLIQTRGSALLPPPKVVVSCFIVFYKHIL